MLDLFALESGVRMHVYMSFGGKFALVFELPLPSLGFGWGPESRSCKIIPGTQIITGWLNRFTEQVDNRMREIYDPLSCLCTNRGFEKTGNICHTLLDQYCNIDHARKQSTHLGGR